MPRVKQYPRARMKAGAFDQAIAEQGRVIKWVAQQAGVTPVRLRDFRNGLELPLSRAELIARALNRELEQLFDVVQAPPAAEGAVAP